MLQAADAEEYIQDVPGRLRRPTLTRSKSLNQAVLVTSDMPPPPDGKVYELWLDHEGVGMVPAGLMPDESDGRCCSRATPRPPSAPGSPSSPGRTAPRSPPARPVALFPFENDLMEHAPAASPSSAPAWPG